MPDIRLVNGFSNSSGRIEIFIYGEWGTVCDNKWDTFSANVACRQLGYPAALVSYRDAFFGEGVGRIWLTNIVCSGNEFSLLECKHERFYSPDCTHKQDVSVLCGGKESFD